MGLLLWLWLQDVSLWAHAEGGRRDELFDPAAAERRAAFGDDVAAHPELSLPAGVLTDLLRAPGDVHAGAVQEACLEIARWAAAAGCHATALSFAVAAAEADPGSGAAAAAVGRLALRFGRYTLAEVWLSRALALSRRAGEWESYCRACILLGRLREMRGDLTKARRYHVHAWRMGRRHVLPAARAYASFELLRLAIAARDVLAAERLLRRVQRGFPTPHPEHRRVWSDIAGLWLVHGHPERALPLLQSLVKARLAPAERIGLLTLLTCAGSAMRSHGTVKGAWDEAVALIQGQGETETTGRQLLDLARAAADSLEAWRVRQVVWRAREIARRFGQTDVEVDATRMLWTTSEGGESA